MNPYRTIPITYSERVSKLFRMTRKVITHCVIFFKDYQLAFILCGLGLFGACGLLVFITRLSERSCREGAALIRPGQLINCSSSAETIRASNTPQGVIVWCECPNHEHNQDLP